MQLRFKSFQSSMSSWESLFEDAARFASDLGPKRVVSISHSEGGRDWGANGVVTVWYWDRNLDDPE